MARTLRSRRMINRGIGARVQAAWANHFFMSTSGIGNRATLTTNLTGANNDLYLFSKVPGTTGNAITFRIVVAGNNTPLSVSVTGSAITVNSATDSGGVPTSTAADVRKAVNLFPAAYLLVHAQNAPQNDGTGVVTALAATNLTGAV
jgi:hypothetical protein